MPGPDGVRRILQEALHHDHIFPIPKNHLPRFDLRIPTVREFFAGILHQLGEEGAARLQPVERENAEFGQGGQRCDQTRGYPEFLAHFVKIGSHVRGCKELQPCLARPGRLVADCI